MLINTQTDDDILIEKAIRGDKNAFSLIVEKYHRAVCAVAYSKTGDLDTSEDIAQETFLTAWKKLSTLKSDSKICSWLCTIARNLCVSNFRKNSRMSYGETYENASAEMAASGKTADNIASDAEMREYLWKTLETLPEIFREPLILYYREEHSIKMTAEAMGISEETVKTRLSRGRELLREKMSEILEQTLTKTGPDKKAFTLSVIALIPVAVPSGTAAATTTALLKAGGGISLKASLSFLAGLLGPICGIIGAIIGARASIRAARSSEEKKYVTKFTYFITILVITFILANSITVYLFNKIPVKIAIPLISAIIFAYTVSLFFSVRIGNKRISEIRKRTGTEITQEEMQESLEKNKKYINRSIYGSFGGSIFGSLAWIMIMSFITHDILYFFITLIFAFILFVSHSVLATKHIKYMFKLLSSATVAVCLFTIFSLESRVHIWLPSMKMNKNQLILYQNYHFYIDAAILIFMFLMIIIFIQKEKGSVKFFEEFTRNN